MQGFIALKLRREEGTVTRIKEDRPLHQRQIFTKMKKPLFILLGIADSNHPHIDKLQFMVLMVNDHISISMYEINDEDYFLPVT